MGVLFPANVYHNIVLCTYHHHHHQQRRDAVREGNDENWGRSRKSLGLGALVHFNQLI